MISAAEIIEQIILFLINNGGDIWGEIKNTLGLSDAQVLEAIKELKDLPPPALASMKKEG